MRERETEMLCQRCPSERLVAVLGNLLVCPSCEIVYVQRSNVNNFVGLVEVLDETESSE